MPLDYCVTHCLRTVSSFSALIEHIILYLDLRVFVDAPWGGSLRCLHPYIYVPSSYLWIIYFYCSYPSIVPWFMEKGFAKLTESCSYFS